MEFVPGENKSQGYNAKMSLEKSGKFPLPKNLKEPFTAITTWGLSNDDAKKISDASGINIDTNGNLILFK
ncbi:MAG: hypothetical protein U0T83_08400 [Bacteriovoracaceae bacterium]